MNFFFDDQVHRFQSRFIKAILDQTRQESRYLTLIDTSIKDYHCYFTLHQTKLLVQSLKKLRLFLQNDRDKQGLIFVDIVFVDGPRKIKLKCAREKTSLVIVIWQDYWSEAKQKWIKKLTSQDGANVKMIRIVNEIEYINLLHFLIFFCD